MNKGLKILFVSTGRCGTTRLTEILQSYLPPECMVVHQTRFSHLANVIGNIQYHFPLGETPGNFIYNKMTRPVPGEKNFVSVDPLSPMIVPSALIKSDKTYIIHIVRQPDEFAVSMYRLTRKKKKSFIAHNFIPFWQPYLFPLENILSRNILAKYRYIHGKKNDFFVHKFSGNPNYIKISMDKIFRPDVLADLFTDILGVKIEIPPHELLKKTNQS